jgi:predicted esterase
MPTFDESRPGNGGGVAGAAQRRPPRDRTRYDEDMSLRVRCLCYFLASATVATARPAAGTEPPHQVAAAIPAPQAVSYTLDGIPRQGVSFVPDRPGPKPLVLLFDPNGDASGAVNTWVPAASKAGWIVASTPRVRNGTADVDDAREMLALLDALRQRHQIDGRRIYSGGWSGGGCGAYLLALTRPEIFAGSFVQVAHMGSWRENRLASRISRTDQSYYLLTRTNDFNRPAMQQLATALRGAGLEVMLVERPGVHQGMSGEEVAAALDWMQRRPPSR